MTKEQIKLFRELTRETDFKKCLLRSISKLKEIKEEDFDIMDSIYYNDYCFDYNINNNNDENILYLTVYPVVNDPNGEGEFVTTSHRGTNYNIYSEYNTKHLFTIIDRYNNKNN